MIGQLIELGPRLFRQQPKDDTDRAVLGNLDEFLRRELQNERPCAESAPSGPAWPSAASGSRSDLNLVDLKTLPCAAAPQRVRVSLPLFSGAQKDRCHFIAPREKSLQHSLPEVLLPTIAIFIRLAWL